MGKIRAKKVNNIHICDDAETFPFVWQRFPVTQEKHCCKNVDQQTLYHNIFVDIFKNPRELKSSTKLKSYIVM